jgi:hypothetical protein
MSSPGVKTNIPYVLMIGDALSILAVTWLGFISHGESIASPRWLTTYLPVCAAWALQAPWLGLYRREVACNPRQVGWRVILAMVLAAPLAGFFRALLLKGPVIPSFVAVLGFTSAAGVAVWRLAYTLFSARANRHG